MGTDAGSTAKPEVREHARGAAHVQAVGHEQHAGDAPAPQQRRAHLGVLAGVDRRGLDADRDRRARPARAPVAPSRRPPDTSPPVPPVKSSTAAGCSRHSRDREQHPPQAVAGWARSRRSRRRPARRSRPPGPSLSGISSGATIQSATGVLLMTIVAAKTSRMPVTTAPPERPPGSAASRTQNNPSDAREEHRRRARHVLVHVDASQREAVVRRGTPARARS